MKRSWLITIAFISCMAAAAGALAWVTLSVVALERAETAARRQAALEDAVRLALWRADSTLAPLVMQESLMPWSAFRPNEAVPSAGARPNHSATVPTTTPFVLVRFQFEADGRLVSPDVPAGVPALAGSSAADRPKSESHPVNADHADRHSADGATEAEKNLATVAKIAPPAKLRSLLPEPPVAPLPQSNQGNFVGLNQSALPPEQQNAYRDRGQWPQNVAQAQVEYNLRNGMVGNNDPNFVGNNGLANVQNSMSANSANRTNYYNSVAAMNVPGVPLTPLWLDGHLLLARRVSLAGREIVQGCLLDWPAIRNLLVETVKMGDLLPAASFEPVTNAARVDPARSLAALPIGIVPGELPPGDAPRLSPIRLSLIVAWGCMVLTAAAVAGLLMGILRLSNRRASFVTAVTHELRTPLTTFQMYVEMLAEGMVPPGEPSQRYFKTLRAEVTRLTHMVENILAYARLERGRNIGRVEKIAVGQLIDGVQSRLTQRAEQAGRELVVDVAAAERQCLIKANPSAVDQILFNLVDNACKYSAQAEDKRIHLEVQALTESVELRVRDHGPGMPPPRRLFRSFDKTAQDAAQSAPGIGLGLALSRRLARHIGGELRVVPSPQGGACVALNLARSG